MKEETEACHGAAENEPDPAPETGHGRNGLRGLILIASYLLAALLSLAVSGPLAGWPVIWLPYGIALAAFLTSGRSVWPWIMVAAALAALTELQ